MTAGEVAAHFGWPLEQARNVLEQLFLTERCVNAVVATASKITPRGPGVPGGRPA